MKSPSKQAESPNYVLIALFIGIIYLVAHVGFYKTYWVSFPDFKGFELLHHIHGMLMVSWLLLLIIQPLLIRSGKYRAHRFLGKLSYFIAPLVLASMFLILRLGYHKGISSNLERDVIAGIALNIPQLLEFPLFYLLAIISILKNDPARHMRYMIGTALIMISAGLGRVLIVLLKVEFNTALLTTLYIEAGLATVFLLYDLVKKKDYIPNLIIASSFIISTLIYYERYSDFFQAFGRFFTRTFF